jgi:hypothetical protein
MTAAPATTPAAARRGGPQGGPPLLAPALAYAALTIASVALSARIPQADASAASLLAYVRSHHTFMQVAGCLEFAAAVPLAIWTATGYRRLRTLGVNAPGAVIGLSGGLLAAASLALSGLVSWTVSQVSGTVDAGLARVLADLSFATGGTGFVAPLGLLLAGMAVPALILRLLPRWLAWTGLVVAAIAELSTFSLLTGGLDVTLPVGRFGGLLWLLAVSVLLPRSRHDLRPAAAGPARVRTAP